VKIRIFIQAASKIFQFNCGKFFARLPMAENKNFSNFIKLFVQVRSVCQTRAINFQLMPVRHKNNFMAYYFFFCLFFLFLFFYAAATRVQKIMQLNK